LATDLDGNLREDILQGLYEYEKSADDDGHQVLRTPCHGQSANGRGEAVLER
jgi:hypothetical protein